MVIREKQQSFMLRSNTRSVYTRCVDRWWRLNTAVKAARLKTCRICYRIQHGFRTRMRLQFHPAKRLDRKNDYTHTCNKVWSNKTVRPQLR